MILPVFQILLADGRARDLVRSSAEPEDSSPVYDMDLGVSLLSPGVAAAYLSRSSVTVTERISDPMVFPRVFSFLIVKTVDTASSRFNASSGVCSSDWDPVIHDPEAPDMSGI